MAYSIYSKAGTDEAISSALADSLPTTPVDIGAATAAQGALADATTVEQVALTAPLAYTLPEGTPASVVHRVVFTQDATGGHTVTYCGEPVAVDLTAGAVTTVELHPVGTGCVVRYPADAIPGSTGPRWSAHRYGVRYDGTDQTAKMQALLAAVSAAGGGVIELDGLVRCDGQLTIPTALSGYQLRQAPIRITGTVQTQPGSVFSEVTPYPKMGGLDLRYAGRTDAGCTTTKGSAVVLNPAAQASDRGLMVSGPGMLGQAWILAVDPGVSWTLYRPARATGVVSLACYGARIQSYGYGTLELDHLQLVSGAATSAPFVGSTATTIIAHDNLIAGSTAKSYGTCDEDPFILGGPGQGTRLTAGLTAGTPYTTLTVAPLPVGVTTGRRLLIGAGTAGEQEVTLAASAVTGDTTLTVASFTPVADHPVSQSVYIGYAQSQINPTSWTVPSCPFQGYGTEITRNHFHRTRRIYIGGFASSLSIRRNAWMHNTGSTLAAAPSTLTAGLTAGTTYTSLPVTALSREVLAGDVIQTGVGSVSQEWVASADAAVGATAISVASAAANATYASGTVVFNTAHLGAAIESHAIAAEINAPLISENRIGVIGFSYAVRLSGATMHAYVAANDCQDAQASTLLVAGYRFDRRWLWGAQFNLLIPGLVGNATWPILDDWSHVDGRLCQTVLNHDQSRPSQFSQGVSAVGETSRTTPSGVGANATYSPKVLVPNEANAWQWSHNATDVTLRHTTAGVEAAMMRLRDSPTGVNHTIDLYPSGYAKLGSSGDLRLTAKSGGKVYLGGSDAPTTVYVMNATLYTPVVVHTPTTTAARPAAAAAGAGATLYDSNLGKMILSNGTAWVNLDGTALA